MQHSLPPGIPPPPPILPIAAIIFDWILYATRYRWHLEKIATQMPAISWQLVGYFWKAAITAGLP